MPTPLRSLAVFCGTNFGFNPQYAEGAQALGREIARRGSRATQPNFPRANHGRLTDRAMPEHLLGLITATPISTWRHWARTQCESPRIL